MTTGNGGWGESDICDYDSVAKYRQQTEKLNEYLGSNSQTGRREHFSQDRRNLPEQKLVSQARVREI